MSSLINLKSKLKQMPKFDIAFLSIVSIWCMSIPFDNSIYQAGWVLVLLSFFCHIFYYKNLNILKDILVRIKPVVILFLCLWIVMFISNLLNTDVLSKDSFKITIYFFVRFALVFLAICYFYKLNIIKENNLIYPYIVGVCILALGGIWYALLNGVEHGIEGVLRNRNGFGLSVGFGLVVISLFLKDKFIKPILVFVFLFLVAFSFSRSTWVGSFCALSFYAILNLKEIKKQHLIFVFMLVVAVIAVYFLSDSLQSRFSDLARGESSYRFGIWSYTFSKVLEQPFFGYGIDSFQHLPNAPFLTNSHYSAPHNMIMELLFSTGIFGLVFFMGLNLYIFLNLLKSKNYKTLAVFAYIFVACQFDFGVFDAKELLSVVVIFSFLALKERIVS